MQGSDCVDTALTLTLSLDRERELEGTQAGLTYWVGPLLHVPTAGSVSKPLLLLAMCAIRPPGLRTRSQSSVSPAEMPAPAQEASLEPAGTQVSVALAVPSLPTV